MTGNIYNNIFLGIIHNIDGSIQFVFIYL